MKTISTSLSIWGIVLERFSGNWVCLKDGEIEECRKDDWERRTGLYFTDHGDSSTRTSALRFLFKCSLVWLPLLPLSTSLATCEQWFVCIPVAFLSQPQGVWATEGNVHASVYAHVHIYNREHMRAPVPVDAYTEAWPRVHKLFCFHPMLELENIFYLQNIQQHHQISNPFHLLSLPSVTPASMPCLMDFQMQVHDFFQDLTGIFFCV